MPTILVVEDEPILRDLIARELRRTGYEVATQPDGLAAWQYLQSETPDLILLDLLMPLMSGYDLLEKMRKVERLKMVPCIVLSNSGHINDLERAYSYGANDVLIKADFRPQQVVTKIQELLATAAAAPGQPIG